MSTRFASYASVLSSTVVDTVFVACDSLPLVATVHIEGRRWAALTAALALHAGPRKESV